MHELAPLTLSSPKVAPWEKARVPARLLEGYAALHLKVPVAKEADLIATFQFPAPMRFARLGEIDGLWIGPGEWLFLASPNHHAQLAELEGWTRESGLASAGAGSRLAILELGGSADFVAGLTGLPVTSLAPGRTARTRLADIAITLAAKADGTIRLIFDRSYAPHMRTWFDLAT